MEKLWTGRFSKELNQTADDFNSSISFDARLYRQDIRGSVAHAEMLAKQGILSNDDRDAIIAALADIRRELDEGTLTIDPAAEDIHMFIEATLTKRIGDAGKRLHTARSRNDQVALDIRLYLREACQDIIAQLRTLIAAVISQAEQNRDAILPGYTHLQRAQPIAFAHHLLAYGMMFCRDISRLQDALARMNVSPLGSCALAGTTYPIDRAYTAEALGFSDYTRNSIDGVSDRDFCVEINAALSILMMHLSRFSEEIILWSSWEFKFVELDDSFTTGSSIMPQKKNSDMAELVRGKTGRVYGNLIGTLTMLKGLPLAYNKDMQEDKEAIFDSIDTVDMCLAVFAPMIETMKVNRENMYNAARQGFINATDLADYLVRKDLPFRTAYKIVGQIVSRCISDGQTLDTLPLAVYKEFSPLFEDDLYVDISLKTCVEKRISAGGTGANSIEEQIQYLREVITK